MKRYPLLAVLCLLAGCHSSTDQGAPAVNLRPTATVTKPQLRTILRTVEQPGIILPYEKTAIYTKISGFVKEWYVDVGARVRKGDHLLDLDVPELVEEYEQKKTLVKLDEAAVVQADKMVLVAQSNLETAKNLVQEAESAIARMHAEVERWESEFERVKKMVKEKVLNNQILDETLRQFKSSMALQDQAMIAVKTKDSQRAAAFAAVQKAKADLAAAKAKVEVAKSDAKRVEALLTYTVVTAPFDAVVTARNVSLGDFVQPGSGDPSKGMDAPGQSAGHATPLYILVRSDVLMFSVGVPETDAPYVKEGSKAVLRIPALAGMEIETKVTRLSWSLNNISRTQNAEIDLHHPDPNIRPGMYAYGTILIERPNVRSVPLNAIVHIGNQPCCYCVVNGKAVRTAVQLGVTDGTWIEVARKRMPSTGTGGSEWVEFNGEERVITSGNVSELLDGQGVTVKE